MTIKFTHNAFLTRRYQECLSFYCDFCEMRVVKERHGEAESLPRIAWLAPCAGIEPIFVIAECPGMTELTAQSEPIMRHFGFEMVDRLAVDRHYQSLHDAALNPSQPSYWGPVAGYLFFVRDPDGRVIEFSAEQDVSHANWDRR